MKQLFALCLAAACWISSAQQLPTGVQISPNLVGLSMMGTTLTGTVPIEAAGGLSGGSTPGHIVATNTVAFGYVTGTAAYRYAFNTALQNSGMSFLGYNYSWQYYNQDLNRGTLTANVNFESTVAGATLHNKSWTLPATTEGWTTVSGTELFANNVLASNVSGIKMSFTGKDDRFWAGYYGPMVRNPSLTLQYTFDACSANPLSSPECPGYAAAYQTQQCTANPLYSVECPGYAVAYQTQQCTISALYSPQCPGHTEAYQTQQCTANPLYATTCTGYAEAYKAQQCNLNGLYDRTCPNYAEAYAKANVLSPTTTTTITTPVATTTATTETASNPVTVAISDPVVKSAVTTSETTSPTSVTSTVSVINPPKTQEIDTAIKTVSMDVPLTQSQQQEKAADTKKTDTAVATVERRAGGNQQNAKAAAAAQAKDLAKRAAEAPTMEAQTATQGLVVGLMGYVPGFSAYQNAIIPDALAAQVARQYHKPTVDNRSAQRQLSGSNEVRWKQMVDSQYRGN